MGRTISMSKYVDVDFDVDLGEFDTKDLVDELTSRQVNATDMPVDAASILDNLRLALKLGQDDRALELSRAFVGAHFGIIL